MSNIFSNGVVSTSNKKPGNNLFANSIVPASRKAGGGNSPDYRVGIVQYIITEIADENGNINKFGKYHVKLHNGDIIPIKEEYCTLKDVILVFSLPDNVTYPPGTARKLKKAIKEEFWFMYERMWGKYKINEKLKGDIEDNIFIPKQ